MMSGPNALILYILMLGILVVLDKKSDPFALIVAYESSCCHKETQFVELKLEDHGQEHFCIC